MRAVITVLGKDTVGIIAGVSEVLKGRNANILDISQSVFEDIFAMIMMVDIGGISTDFASFAAALDAKGEEMGLKIFVMHEDVFNQMHRV